jgi:hypothetical protein
VQQIVGDLANRLDSAVAVQAFHAARPEANLPGEIPGQDLGLAQSGGLRLQRGQALAHHFNLAVRLG